MSAYIKNIRINYLFLIKDINVTQGIWMLYLASKGLNLFAIGTLEAIFHITSFLMETPTGAAADLFGRKTSRLIGLVFAAVSSAVIVVSDTYFGIAAGFVLAALSYNFESGAGEALVYDSLLAEGQESRFMKITGNFEMGYQSISVAGLLLGGWLGNIEYAYVYYASVMFSIIGFIIGLFFKEPPIGVKIAHPRQSLPSAIKKQYADSFALIKSSPRLTYLLLFVNMALAGSVMTFYYVQLSLEQIGFSPFQIGVYLVVSTLAAVGGAVLAAKLHHRLGEQKLINAGALIISASVVLCFFTKLSLLPFSVLSFTEAVLFVATRDYINKLIPSDKRATLLSFDSMVFSFCMIVLFPLFGLVADQTGIPIAFLVFGGVLLVFSFIGTKVKTAPT